jgi:hypothetical protein
MNEVHNPHFAESARIEFLLQRDGAEARLIWVQRTLLIYRRALLNRKHFAHLPDYRRKFIASYLSFRRWLVWSSNYGNKEGGAKLACTND